MDCCDGRRQQVSDGFHDLKLSVVFEGEEALRIIGEIQVESLLHNIL